MNNKYKSDEDIIAWLESEYAQPFEGWDFSYLTQRRIHQESLPWRYDDVVLPCLSAAADMLDIDTGGGEILAKLLKQSGFSGKASAVEDFSPNIAIAAQHLAQFDVTVYDTSASPIKLENDQFDLVINRHGGSLSPEQTYSALKPGGYFITEQIGHQTNQELRELFNAMQQPATNWPHCADDARHHFEGIGFTIETLTEYCYPIRFTDVGALTYYLKAVPWEVPGFTVAAHAEPLIQLHHDSATRGFAIDASYHAYLLVAQKPISDP